LAPFVRAQRGRLTRMSIAAVVGGFAEAITLVLIARIALALTRDTERLRIHLGPFGGTSVSVEVLIVAAAAILVARVALQGVYTVLASRTQFTVIAQLRASLVRQYLAAGWPLQASQREGRLQELLTTYANASAGAVKSFADFVISGFNVAALLITA